MTARVTLTVWAFLAMTSTTAPADGLTLDDLMRSLAAVGPIDAQFREKKHLALLQEPLETMGILRFRPPDYLSKRVILPQRHLLEVAGERLTVEDPEQGRRVLSVRDHPAIHAMVESVRATLAGDLQALSSHYELALSGPTDAWQLKLTPRTELMADFVESIVINGAGDRVLGVATEETGGDRSDMSITPSEN